MNQTCNISTKDTYLVMSLFISSRRTPVRHKEGYMDKVESPERFEIKLNPCFNAFLVNLWKFFLSLPLCYHVNIKKEFGSGLCSLPKFLRSFHIWALNIRFSESGNLSWAILAWPSLLRNIFTSHHNGVIRAEPSFSGLPTPWSPSQLLPSRRPKKCLDLKEISWKLFGK